MNISLLQRTEIVLIDNFDSFTYNLVNQLKPLVKKIRVFRNSVSMSLMKETLQGIEGPKVILLSPGPGNPDGAGITLEVIQQYKGHIPILGICLGHQAIIQSYSGIIGAAKSIVHGKSCNILFDQESPIFFNLESPFRAARYHSLAAIKMPKQLKTIATCDSDVMAVIHEKDKTLGFQFHPESLLTPKGGQLLMQSLQWLVKEFKLQDKASKNKEQQNLSSQIK